MIRRAAPSDAPRCAAILDDRIRATEWMPRVHAIDAVERHFRDRVLPRQRVWAPNDPVDGVLSRDVPALTITALHVDAASRGRGVGGGLLDAAKAEADVPRLRTFRANEPARRFRERHGFRRIGETDGDDEEGMPDLIHAWRR